MSTTYLNEAVTQAVRRPVRKPRLGFLGLGWIGCNRLNAVARSGLAEIAGIADTSPAQIEVALKATPDAAQGECLEELLALDLDGIVIATPSALHASQVESALSHGVAVFCQKPLGRTGSETARVIAAAREGDRLLGVDLSYRHLTPTRQIRELCRQGDLGKIYAMDMVFHNAYGPDKPWFYDPVLSGGGCVIDLGVHFIDLALWTLGFPRVQSCTSRLFSKGKPLASRSHSVEDFAEARLDLETGALVRLACSWKLHAGSEAIISGTFYGDQGGAAFHNIDGSFYNFAGSVFRGTRTEVLFSGNENWGDRAITDWVQRLALSNTFDPGIENLLEVARTMDSIYEAGTEQPMSPGRLLRDELG